MFVIIYPLLCAFALVMLAIRHAVRSAGRAPRYVGRHRLGTHERGSGADDRWAATLHVWALHGEQEGLMARSRG